MPPPDEDEASRMLQKERKSYLHTYGVEQTDPSGPSVLALGVYYSAGRQGAPPPWEGIAV